MGVFASCPALSKHVPSSQFAMNNITEFIFEIITIHVNYLSVVLSRHEIWAARVDDVEISIIHREIAELFRKIIDRYDRLHNAYKTRLERL